MIGGNRRTGFTRATRDRAVPCGARTVEPASPTGGGHGFECAGGTPLSHDTKPSARGQRTEVSMPLEIRHLRRLKNGHPEGR
jgi:hypothetical protein